MNNKGVKPIHRIGPFTIQIPHANPASIPWHPSLLKYHRTLHSPRNNADYNLGVIFCKEASFQNNPRHPTAR
ncbi:MAG: hypothetical protein O3C60_07155 [Planctomycetota bacterium]|nr:hypothetical protein [Planctomycetota bacterium]